MLYALEMLLILITSFSLFCWGRNVRDGLGPVIPFLGPPASLRGCHWPLYLMEYVWFPIWKRRRKISAAQSKLPFHGFTKRDRRYVEKGFRFEARHLGLHGSIFNKSLYLCNLFHFHPCPRTIALSLAQAKYTQCRRLSLRVDIYISAHFFESSLRLA